MAVAEHGYVIRSEGNTITLRQTVNDWCPEEYEKTRLKEYQAPGGIQRA